MPPISTPFAELLESFPPSRPVKQIALQHRSTARQLHWSVLSPLSKRSIFVHGEGKTTYPVEYVLKPLPPRQWFRSMMYSRCDGFTTGFALPSRQRPLPSIASHREFHLTSLRYMVIALRAIFRATASFRPLSRPFSIDIADRLCPALHESAINHLPYYLKVTP